MNITNHYNLTKKQLAILDLLFRFRFATSEQLSQALNITTATINKRLKLMLELNYIGRNYNSNYVVVHKYASYYLLPEGIKLLKQLGSPKKYSPDALRNARKAKRLSEKFIEQCLVIFTVHNMFKKQYGDSLRFFTKIQLTNYPHFPDSDGYIRLAHEKEEMQFFLDVIYEHPFFLASGKVKQYLKFAKEEAGIWEEKTNSELPHVLLICENTSLQKRLVKKMRRSIEEGDMQFYIITIDEFKHNHLWHDMSDPGGGFCWLISSNSHLACK
jgi:DNA-binding MarR family transcriptional regulator